MEKMLAEYMLEKIMNSRLRNGKFGKNTFFITSNQVLVKILFLKY